MNNIVKIENHDEYKDDVLNSSKKDEGLKNLNDAVKIIDKTAGKGIIHKNKAANKKSNLYKYTNKLK